MTAPTQPTEPEKRSTERPADEKPLPVIEPRSAALQAYLERSYRRECRDL